MSDATLLAGEIQDLASTVGEVADAIRKQPAPQVAVNVPEQPAPVVNVAVAPAPAPAPVVQVNVPEQPAPVVNVASADLRQEIIFPPQLPSSYEVVVTERDDSGFIRRFTITPTN